jgi:hypothetical protein
VKGSLTRVLSDGRAYLFFRRFFFQKNSPFFRILGSTKTASGNRLYTRLTSKVSIKSNNKQTLFFQLFVRSICGKTITIQVQPLDTVGAVKGKVQEKHGQELGDQYLTYAGKRLDDSRAIADYGIGQGCTLELSSRLLGGCYWCHDQRHNPGAPSHRSRNCLDPNNTWSTKSQRQLLSDGRPHTARGGGGGKPPCKYGSACYRKNPIHLAKYDHSSRFPEHHVTPTHGREMTMYHGTSQAAAIQIKKGGEHGLRPSTSGMLGAGIYCSRELQKAQAYAKGNGGGVIFELRVRVGKVKRIDLKGHPLQKTWHQAGYDTAWVPPGCGVNPSGLEEDCVWDPKRVRIVRVAWSDCGFTW